MGRLALVVFAEVAVNWQYLYNIKCLNLAWCPKTVWILLDFIIIGLCRPTCHYHVLLLSLFHKSVHSAQTDHINSKLILEKLFVFIFILFLDLNA